MERKVQLSRSVFVSRAFRVKHRDGGQGGLDATERFRPFTELEFKILGQVELGGLRLADVRSKLGDLARMETVLSKLVGECEAQQGDVSCPLIDALHES